VGNRVNITPTFLVSLLFRHWQGGKEFITLYVQWNVVSLVCSRELTRG
jgi:hypothetical protein